jgi:hypothetical protein
VTEQVAAADRRQRGGRVRSFSSLSTRNLRFLNMVVCIDLVEALNHHRDRQYLGERRSTSSTNLK